MRYYYDDPLAAAWMQKNHAMRFWYAGQETWIRSFSDLMESDWSDDFRVEVHHESLSLLEPQMGDLLSINGGVSAAIINYPDMLEQIIVMRHQFEKPETIIQRNGIAFIWPKQENPND